MSTSRAIADILSDMEHLQTACPECGSEGLLSMAETRTVLRSTSGSSEFAADLAEWLSPPRRPEFKPSKRRRLGVRNAFAFGLVMIAILTVAHLAFIGRLPGPVYFAVALTLGIGVGIRTWFVETRLAREEDVVRYESHRARYRAYLRRKRIWERLNHCTACGAVSDPITHKTSTLYEVHELVNTSDKK